MLPLLYVVRLDIEKSFLPVFVRWYDTRHAPDLIAAGFFSCNAYHAVEGGPFICNIYEIPGVEVFDSQAYVQVRHNDLELAHVLPMLSNHSNTTYVQEIAVGVPERALRASLRPSREGALTAPVVATLRFDIELRQESELRKWFRHCEAAAQSESPGWLRSRLARQEGKHPLFPSRQPQWLVVTEWASLDQALARDTTAAVLQRYTTHFGASISALQYTVSALNATLLNSTNWTV